MTTHPLEDSSAVGHYFNTRWDEYEKAVSEDYLGHRGNFAAAHQLLLQHFTSPYKMLDLGCGDARFTRSLIDGTPLAHYTGVDLSANALERARANLDGLPISLRVGNAFVFEDDAQYDVCFASLSMHHLTRPQKEEFLYELLGRLTSGGVFILIDLVTADGNDTDRARAILLDYIRSWSVLEEDERARVIEHVSSADYPESIPWLEDAAQTAGFRTEKLYLDPRGYTACLAFWKP